MASAKRVGDEPAYILHQYDWSESSLILEVFTRHRGRVALAAKGVKRHTSNFRPVLLPLQPLKLSYTLGAEGNAEIHSLKGAEWVGGHVMPQGDALWSGMYLNELLLRLLARDDPYAALFDIYAGVVRVLAGQHGGTTEAIEPVLRAFELVLLRARPSARSEAGKRHAQPAQQCFALHAGGRWGCARPPATNARP
jgi:DNA repair protein RecO